MAAKRAKKKRIANEGGTNETGGEQKTWRTGDGRFAGDLPAKQRKLLYPAGCREHLRETIVQPSGPKRVLKKSCFEGYGLQPVP
jgi:hypothetical protein